MLLTIKEASKLTRISVGTLYHWVSERRIPVVRLSARCIRFRLADLEEWIQQNAEPPRKTELDWTPFGKDTSAGKRRRSHAERERDTIRNNPHVGMSLDPKKTT